MKKFKRIILGLGLLSAGYFMYQHFLAAPQSAQVHYITEPVKRGDLDKSVLATGSVRASQRTEVGAQVSGKIQKLYVEMGQVVQKGQLIAEIDSETQQNELNTARAELASSQAQLHSRRVALNVAQANYTRLSTLYRQKSTSLSELEKAQNELALAKANLEEINVQIQVKEIAVNTAKTNLGYTKILSPIDGVVVSIPISEGQTVNANQTSPTIVQVANVDKALIKFEIAEGDIAQVKPEQTVSFTPLADPGRRYQGTIFSVDPALTTLTDNTYKEASGNSDAVYYYANALIENHDHHLRIGMTVQGKVIIAEKKAVLLVPNSALKKQGQTASVQVLEKGKAVEKTVTIGLSDNNYTEILTGLNEGESVITTQRTEGEPVGGGNVRLRF